MQYFIKRKKKKNEKQHRERHKPVQTTNQQIKQDKAKQNRVCHVTQKETQNSLDE